MSRHSRQKHGGHSDYLTALPRTAAVDGVKYLQQHVAEARHRLAGTNLLEGKIWPVERAEMEEWDGHAYAYLMASSRVIGAAVVDTSGPPAERAPQLESPSERLISSRVVFDGGKRRLVGDTATGTVEIEFLFAGLDNLGDAESRRRILEQMDKMRVVPSGDPDHVYNACTTTLLGEQPLRRLILAKEDVPLVERHFLGKIALVGADTLADLMEMARQEFAESPNGIVLRLRRICEKLAPYFEKQPSDMSLSVMASAALHTNVQKHLDWFANKLARHDLDFFALTTYIMLAREHFDPLAVTDSARALAEDRKFRHEYRRPGIEAFDSQGITQLLYETFRILTLGRDRSLQEVADSLSSSQAQREARIGIFLREMAQVVQRREAFEEFLRTGSFPVQ